MLCLSCEKDDDCRHEKPYTYVQAMVISDYPWAGVSPQFYAKIVFEGDKLEHVTEICLENYKVNVSNNNYSGTYTITDFYITNDSSNGRLVVEFFGPFLHQYPHIHQIHIDRIIATFSYNWYGSKQQITN